MKRLQIVGVSFISATLTLVLMATVFHGPSVGSFGKRTIASSEQTISPINDEVIERFIDHQLKIVCYREKSTKTLACAHY